MKQVLKTAIIGLIFCLIHVPAQAQMATRAIVFAKKAAPSIEGYLNDLYIQILLIQYGLDSNDRICVTDNLNLDVRFVPESLRPALKQQLQSLIAGQIQVWGARIDFSRAFVKILDPDDPTDSGLRPIDARHDHSLDCNALLMLPI